MLLKSPGYEAVFVESGSFDLPPGEYTIQVQDSNGCISISRNVEIQSISGMK